MQTTRNSLDTAAGSDDRFAGSVFIDTVAAPSHGSSIDAAATAWSSTSSTKLNSG